MRLEFTAPIWEWRGPAPFYFVSVPDEESRMVAAASQLVTYGWGMIPATITIGSSTFTTSLWPKDGGYVVPLKLDVRRAESIDLGDEVRLLINVGV
ncbi:MAG: DUF1905 domain-containing protein [Microbacteriaceae bacterium]